MVTYPILPLDLGLLVMSSLEKTLCIQLLKEPFWNYVQKLPVLHQSQFAKWSNLVLQLS